MTSTPFNKQNSTLVWTESLRQAQEVLQYWKSLELPIRRISKDTRTLSLHVLSGAEFGKSYSFHKSAETALIYLQGLVGYHLREHSSHPYLRSQIYNVPVPPQKLDAATTDFKYHMTEMVNEEKELIAQGKVGGGNIINSLICASADRSKSSVDVGTDARMVNGLTEDVYGNIFVYNADGHDTMTFTLNSALISSYRVPKTKIGSRTKSMQSLAAGKCQIGLMTRSILSLADTLQFW